MDNIDTMYHERNHKRRRKSMKGGDSRHIYIQIHEIKFFQLLQGLRSLCSLGQSSRQILNVLNYFKKKNF